MILVRKSKAKNKADSQSEKSAKPQRDYLSDEPKTKGSPLTWVKFPVYFCSGIVGLFLLYRSYGLFQTAFSKFGLGGISNVCPTLAYVPFLGEGLASGCSGLAGLVIGIISLTVLLTVTILQVLPTLLYFHPQSISDMVHQLRANLRSREFLNHESSDNAEITTLVKRHNSLSDRSLKTLLVFSVLSFCIEAWIVWVARSGRSDVGSVLVDSLAFDALVAATLAFSNAFRAKPEKVRAYGK